jgi:hypothetical protein
MRLDLECRIRKELRDWRRNDDNKFSLFNYLFFWGGGFTSFKGNLNAFIVYQKNLIYYYCSSNKITIEPNKKAWFSLVFFVHFYCKYSTIALYLKYF